MESNIYNFYKDISTRHNLNDISISLGVNKGTIKRWELLKEVPPQYYFDLCRLDGIEVDYTQYSEKEKDQFFPAHFLSEQNQSRPTSQKVPVLHPGPVNRGVEISSALLEDDSICLIREQVKNGIPIRMALLYLLAAIES